MKGTVVEPLDLLHHAIVKTLEGQRGFKEDKIARDLLVLKAQGFSASEIERELGIEKMQYETAMKRIRRRYVQHILEGRPSDETKEGYDGADEPRT